MRRLFFIAGLLVLLVSLSRAQTPSIGVLDLGATPFAQKTTQKLRERLRSIDEFSVADPDLIRSAAKGIGYSGSLNLSVSEARDLGAADRGRATAHRRRPRRRARVSRQPRDRVGERGALHHVGRLHELPEPARAPRAA